MGVILSDDDDVVSWAKGLKDKPAPKMDDKDVVASIVDDELTSLGYPSTARLSILGDIGRENNWDRNTIFKGHLDPKNKKFNRGLFSYQGDRQTDLDDFIKQNGGDLTPNDDNLRIMARFVDHDLKKRFPQVHQKLQNPKDTYEASEALRQAIKYVPDAPYNTPDDQFRVKNNRIWAERARKLGLAQDIDQDGIWDSVDKVLGDEPQDVPQIDEQSVWGAVDNVLASPQANPANPLGYNGKPMLSPADVVQQPIAQPPPVELPPDLAAKNAALEQAGVAERYLDFNQPVETPQSSLVEPPTVQSGGRLAKPRQTTNAPALNYGSDVAVGDEEYDEQGNVIQPAKKDFIRSVDLRNVPSADKKEHFFQQVIPQLATEMPDVPVADIEKTLRETFQHIKGTPIDKASSYEFKMTPEFYEDAVKNRDGRIQTEEARKTADADFETRKQSIPTDLSGADRDVAEFEQRMAADVAAGLTSQEQADKALAGIKKDVEDWRKDRGFLGIWNEEEWAKLKEVVGNTRGGFSESRGELPQSTKFKSQKDFYEEAYKDTVAQYGSIQKAMQTRREFKKRFENSPMSYIAKVGESAVGGAMKVPFQGAAAALKTLAIAKEAADRLGASGAMGSNDPDAEKKAAYKLAKDIESLAEGVKVDKDFKGGDAELFGNVAGQVILQGGLGILSSGAALPAAFGAAQGAAQQYEDAGKFRDADGKPISPWGRLGASLAGGLIEAPDYFIFKGMLKGGSAVKNASALQNLKATIERGLIKKGMLAPAAERAAIEATDGFLAQMIAKGGWKGTAAKGIQAGASKAKTGSAEFVQESTTQPLNDLAAYMIYDPTPERWAKAITPTKQNFVEGVAGFFGGVIGASMADIAARAENLSPEAVEQSQELVETVKDEIPTETYAAIKEALKPHRGKTVTLQPIVENPPSGGDKEQAGRKPKINDKTLPKPSAPTNETVEIPPTEVDAPKKEKVEEQKDVSTPQEPIEVAEQKSESTPSPIRERAKKLGLFAKGEDVAVIDEPVSPSYSKSRDDIESEMKDEFRRRQKAGEKLPLDLNAKNDKMFERKLAKYIAGMSDSFVRDWHDTIFGKATPTEASVSKEPVTPARTALQARKAEKERVKAEKLGKVKPEVKADQKATVKSAGAIAVPRSAVKRYAYADEVADQIGTDDFKAAERRSQLEKPSARTGFTKTQTEYLAKALQDYDIIPQSDSKILRKIREADDLDDLNKLAKSKDFRGIVPNIKTSVIGDASGNNILSLDTNEAIELARTLHAIASDSDRDTAPVLQGVFLDKQQVHDFREAAEGMIESAEENDVDATELREFIKNLDKAAKENGVVRLEGFEDAREHETIHQASYLASEGKKIEARYATSDELRSDPDFQQFHKALNRLQGDTSHGVALDEALAYLGSGDYKRFGLTREQSVNILQKLVSGFAEANGIESLKHFQPNTELYENIESYRKSQSREVSDDSGRAVSGQREVGRETSTKEPDEDGDGEREKAPKGQKLASLPATLRKYGLQAVDVAYTVYGDNEATQDAVNMFNENGIDGSIKLLENTKNPDASHTILEGIVYDTLAQGDANLRLAADKFLQAASERHIKAGRYTRAVQLMQHNPVLTVMTGAQRVAESVDNNLSDSQVVKFGDLARELEAAYAETQLYKAQSDRFAKDKKNLERRLKNALADKQRKRAAKGRQRIAARVENKFADEISKAAMRVSKLLRDPSLLSVPATDIESALRSIPDEETQKQKDLIDALGTVGAQHLVKGLASDVPFMPETMKEIFVAQYGAETIEPIFPQIYTQAVKVRDKWLKDIARENQKKVISNRLEDKEFEKNMEKALGRELPEKLEDDDILDIMGVTRDIARRQRAIEKMHRLATGVAKTNVSPEMRQMILGEANSNLEAVTAEMIAENRPPTEIYETLESMPELFEGGYSKAKAQQAFVRGKEIHEQAKDDIKNHQDDIKREIAEQTQLVSDVEVAEIEARKRLDHKKQQISDEYQKLKNPKEYYAKKTYVTTMDLLRNLTLSAEMSFLMRQGGKAIRSEAALKLLGQAGKVKDARPAFREAFRTVLPTGLTPNTGERAYAANIKGVENHPLYPEAVRLGMDFSTAGKLGQGVHIGEEQLQSEAIDMMIRGLNKADQYLTDKGLSALALAPKAIRLYPKMIQRFDKSMSVFLDNLRMKLYERMSIELKEQGYDPRKDKKEFEELVRRINSGTSRPNKFDGIGQKGVDLAVESRLFLAPSYTVAKWQDMGADVRNTVQSVARAVAFQGLPKGTQKIIMKRAVASYGALAAQYALVAAALGALVSFDPDDDDFLKLKLGNYRYDLSQGNRTELRYIAKLIKHYDSADTARYNTTKYLRSRLNIIPGFAVSAWEGKDPANQEFSLKDPSRYVGLVAPLTYMNAYKAYKEDGVKGIGYTFPMDFIGYQSSLYPDRVKDLERDKKEAQKRGDFKELDRINKELEKQRPIENKKKREKERQQKIKAREKKKAERLARQSP